MPFARWVLSKSDACPCGDILISSYHGWEYPDIVISWLTMMIMMMYAHIGICWQSFASNTMHMWYMTNRVVLPMRLTLISSFHMKENWWVGGWGGGRGYDKFSLKNAREFIAGRSKGETLCFMLWPLAHFTTWLHLIYIHSSTAMNYTARTIVIIH